MSSYTKRNTQLTSLFNYRLTSTNGRLFLVKSTFAQQIMKALRVYFLLLLLVTGGTAIGQSFVTKVSSTVIGKKDIVQVDYVAENVDLQDFMLPRFTSWELASGPDITSNRLQTGNIIKQQTVYTITLVPKSSGRLTIPGARALINNRPGISNSVFVEVKTVSHLKGNASANANSMQGSLLSQLQMPEEEYGSDQFLRVGEDAKAKIKKNLLIKLEANKRSFYVGEPILVTYKLCTRLRSQSRVVKQPVFAGSTVIEMTTEDPLPGREVIGGRSYNTYVIRRVQLLPLEAGSLTLPAASVENKVAFFNAGNVNYRDLYYNAPSLPVEEHTVVLDNAPLTVDIKPLPPLAGKVFNNAIGKFDVMIGMGKTIETNNTNQFLFTVQGEGNLQQVKAPVIQWPQGIEAFDAVEHVQEDNANFPVRINKTLAIPFIADKPGKYTIPPIQFTFFDPSTNAYITKTTAPYVFNVAAGTTANIVKGRTGNNDSEFQNRLYIILGVGFLLVVAGLIWYNEKFKKHPAPSNAHTVSIPAENVIMQEVSARDHAQYIYNIRELEPYEHAGVFYKQLCANLEGFIASKYNLNPAELPAMIAKDTEESALLSQVKTLLDNCNLGLYTPIFSVEEAMQHRLNAIEVLTRLDKL